MHALLVSVALLALAAPAASAETPLLRTGDGWAAKVVDRGSGQTCLQAGQPRGAQLGRRFASGRFRAHGRDDFAICGPRKRTARTRATLVRHATDGGRIVALLAGGLAGRGAVRAEVTNGAHRRTVRIRRDGAWLVALPAGARLHRLRIVVRYGDGRTEVSDYGRARKRMKPVPGSARIELRGDGRGLLVWRTTRGETCSTYGDVVDGQVGRLNADAGEFFAYPINDGGSCADLERGFKSTPALVSLTSTREDAWVVGFVRDDVERVVITGLAPTPLEPRLSPRHRAFVAEGTADASVTVEAHLRGGGVETIRLGPR